MEISTTNSIYLIYYLCLLKICESYNIDVSHARVLRGPKGSLFGYTSAFQRTTGGYKLIVGAPKDNNERRNGTGATYTCDVSGSLTCKKEYTIRDPNYPEVAADGTWYTDSEMYGSFITETVNNTKVVCAPSFKDLRDNGMNIPFMIGRCVIQGWDERPLFHRHPKNYYKTVGNKTRIFWNGMGQSGFSGDYLADGSIVLGVPGYERWRGGVIILMSGSLIPQQSVTPLEMPAFSYMGYSVVAGNFCGKRHLCFATGGPGKMSGKVFVYQYKPDFKKPGFKLQYTIEGDQAWSYFGASLCAADVNGDGYDDLLVGAPFYTDVDDGKDKSKKVYMDEGRVTVYLNVRKSNRKQGFIRSNVLKGSNEHNARFGTAIANIGNVNNDEYEDVAIGAPYEDEGRGAVYIYHGSKFGVRPKEKQRILGRNIEDTVTSFGWSISKPADVDNNRYQDFAVGNYLSDTAVILRTRPLVKLNVTMATDPELIVRNRSLCHSSAWDECFKLNLCFQYRGKSLPSSLRFNYTLTVDTFKSTEQKRVKLNSKHYTIYSDIKVTLRKWICKAFQVVTMKLRKTLDPFTVVRLEAKYDLHLTEGLSSDIQPVLDQSNKRKTVHDTAFQLACGADGHCWTDLVVTLSSRINNENDDVIRPNLKDTIVINATETVVVNVVMRNKGEDAYATVVHVKWTGNLAMQTINSPPQHPIVCDEETEELDYFTFMRKCDVLFPVKDKVTYRFQLFLSGKDIKEENILSSAAITVSLKTGSNETTPEDNTANLTIPTWIDAKVAISGISLPEQVLVRTDKPPDFKIELRYMYVIKNKGPSYLPSTGVAVDLPYFMPDGSNLVDDVAITLLFEDDPTVTCHPLRGEDSSKATHTSAPPGQAPSESSNEIKSTPPIAQRETTVNHILPKEPSKLVNDIQSKSRRKVVFMDCEVYRCKEFVCALDHLPPDGSAIVNVSIQIPFERLPFNDDVYIRYIPTTTVMKPVHPLLYPWDRPVDVKLVTVIYPITPPGQISIFILLGSILGGILLFLLILVLLWKCGFFKREKRYKVHQWKKFQRQSLSQGSSVGENMDAVRENMDAVPENE